MKQTGGIFFDLLYYIFIYNSDAFISFITPSITALSSFKMLKNFWKSFGLGSYALQLLSFGNVRDILNAFIIKKMRISWLQIINFFSYNYIMTVSQYSSLRTELAYVVSSRNRHYSMPIWCVFYHTYYLLKQVLNDVQKHECRHKGNESNFFWNVTWLKQNK